MSKYIFDWNENSEFMLVNRTCFTGCNQYMELVAFIRFLLDKGENKEDVFYLWRTIDSKIITAYENEEELREKYEEMYNKAQAWSIAPLGPITIFQEEIDFINNMQVLSWVKEYILAMLCVYKYYGVKWCRYSRDIKVFCYSVTHMHRERPHGIPYLSDCINTYKPYSMVLYDSKLAFHMNFAQASGECAGVIRNPAHVTELFYLLKNEKICAQCGKTWTYSFRTINNTICPDCTKHARYKIQNYYKTLKYNRKLTNSIK